MYLSRHSDSYGASGLIYRAMGISQTLSAMKRVVLSATSLQVSRWISFRYYLWSHELLDGLRTGDRYVS